MSNNLQSKFMNRMFRRVEGVVWDLMSNKLGLQNKDGIFTLETTAAVAATETVAASEASFAVTVNPFDTFGFALPAFAQITKIEDIEIGDLIVGDSKALGWVIGKRERSLRLLDQGGMGKDYTPPKVQIMNQDGAMVVKSLTSLLGVEGTTGLQGSLMPLLMMGGMGGGDSGIDLESMLPMLLLTGQNSGGNPNAIASAIPTMLAMQMFKGDKNGGGTGNSMKDMMMMQMMMGGMGGGAGGMNPMMMMMLAGGDSPFGGNAPAQNIGGIPPLQQRNTVAPTLQRRTPGY